MTKILDVRNLDVQFSTPDGKVRAVNDVSFQVREGETLGVVGESGSGKSQIFMAVMGLLANNGCAAGQVLFDDRDMLSMEREALDKIRGAKISMIFQDPMTALNPYMRISKQMTEVLIKHSHMREPEALKKALDTLNLVAIPQADKRLFQYPHELSGGMRQRVMIAMALLTDPKLVIADEPTTGLDVTIQAQVLELFAQLKKDLHTSFVLITHDMGVVAGLCDRVMVMYGGRIAEMGKSADIFYESEHPYTRALLQSMPRLDFESERLVSIPGQPPNLQRMPKGCGFAPRCKFAIPACLQEVPDLRRAQARDHYKACHRDFVA